MFDLAEFLKQSVPVAILLVPIIMALVTGLGESFPAIKGQYQFLLSLILGALIGTPIFWVMTEPVSPGEWVAVVLFGLICGLTASGKYNSAKAAAQKGTEVANAEALPPAEYYYEYSDKTGVRVDRSCGVLDTDDNRDNPK